MRKREVIEWMRRRGGVAIGHMVSHITSSPAESPPGAAPTNLVLTPGDTTASLSWTGVLGATSYNIYRGTTPGGETLIAQNQQTPFGDTGLTNGTTYYYKAAGTNAGGTGPQSSEVSGTPVTTPVWNLDAAAANSLFSNAGGTTPAVDGNRVLYMKNQIANAALNDMVDSYNGGTGPFMKVNILNGQTILRSDYNANNVGLIANSNPSAPTNFDTPNPFTASVVFQRVTYGTGGSIVISNQQGGTGDSFAGWCIGIDSSNNKWYVQLLHNGSQGIMLYGSVISASTWYHLMFTYDGTGVAAGVKLYRFGSADSQSTNLDNLGGLSILATSPTAPFMLFARTNDYRSPMGGDIAESRIWGKVLNAGEIAADSARVVAKYGLAG